MNITAITQDQLIIVDGVPAAIAQIGGFRMERGEWAVHFDSELGIGQIEYLDIRSNQTLTSKEYEAHYAWLVAKHGEYIDWVHQQELEQEKVAAQAAQEQQTEALK